MSDDDPREEEEEGEGSEEEIISATADLLERAGLVIAEVKRRDLEGTRTWDESPEMSERVLVAQLIGQMRIGRQAMKQLNENQRRLDESKKGSEGASKRLKELEGELGRPSPPITYRVPPYMPPAVAHPPPLSAEELERLKAGAALPAHEVPEDDLPVEIVIYGKGTGWLLESFSHGIHASQDCPTFNELTAAFVKAATRLIVAPRPPEGGATI